MMHTRTNPVDNGIEPSFTRHFYKNILCDHCLHDSGLYIKKVMTQFQNWTVTTEARELNGTSVMSLATHNSKREMRVI